MKNTSAAVDSATVGHGGPTAHGYEALQPLVPKLSVENGLTSDTRQQSLASRNCFAMPCSDSPYPGKDEITSPQAGSSSNSIHSCAANDTASQLQAQLAREGLHRQQQLEIIRAETEDTKSRGHEGVSRRSSMILESEQCSAVVQSAVVNGAAVDSVPGTYPDQSRQNKIESNELILAIVKQHIHESIEEDCATELAVPLSAKELFAFRSLLRDRSVVDDFGHN